MYQQIHDSLIELLASKDDPRLLSRKLNIGTAIKQIRKLEKISIADILKKTGIKRTAINSTIQQGECNTSYDKLIKICETLNISLEEFIYVARETARYNFHILKRNEAPIFRYGKTHEVQVFSPPVCNYKDFVWSLIRIQPGKTIENCEHPTVNEVCCILINGHLKLRYGSKEYPIFSNQVFLFDPRVKHDFINEETTGTTEFFMLYHINPAVESEKQRGRKANISPFDTARFVQTIREELSPSKDNLISANTLSQLSAVDYNSIAYLLYRKPKIVFLDKIDALCSLLRMPFESVIKKSQNRYEGWMKIYTEDDKAILDYRFKHGMRIHTHTGLGAGVRSFGIGDMYFDPVQDGMKRLNWRFSDSSFLGIRVEKGVLGVQYGKQSEVTLHWGDTLYANVDIPITLFNAVTFAEAEKQNESPEVKISIFSHPPMF